MKPKNAIILRVRPEQLELLLSDPDSGLRIGPDQTEGKGHPDVVVIMLKEESNAPALRKEFA